MSVQAVINGKTLPGDVDVKGWNIDGESRWKVVSRQRQTEKYLTEQIPIELTQETPASVAIVVKTFISDEISTEATAKKVIDYCFRYLNEKGKLQVGSEVLAQYAVLTRISPWFDNKRGYGIAYNFLAIDKNDGLKWVKPLKNPSFDSWNDYDHIEYWYQYTQSSSCICEPSQLFGNEELGNGQFCVKTYSVQTNERAYLDQDFWFISGATSDDIKDLYLKFSVDALYETNLTTQSKGTAALAFVKGSTLYSSRKFTLISGRRQRISLMCSYDLFYPNSKIDKVRILNGTDNGTVYFDHAKLQEITL